MKKIAIIAGVSSSLSNFRGDLIKSWIEKGVEVYAVAFDDIAKDEVLSLGVKDFKCIELNRTGTNLISDIKSIFLIKKYLNKINPDLILSYTIKPVIYGSIAAKLVGAKSIYSMITGTGFIFTSTSFKARVLKVMASILYKCALGVSKNVIFQNKDDLNEFVELGLVKRDKCKVVNGSGVNMEAFAKTDLPDKFAFMMVGRALYSKGVFEYFDAAKLVKDKYPDAIFYFVGGIDNKADCIPESILQPYFNNGTVAYLGRSNDMSSTLNMCSVLVLPSYKEGTPRSVLEGMSKGRAILTTDVPGCRETVIDGDNGFLVKHKDSVSLYEKMIWFIENQDKLESMGNSSYAYCLDKFEVSKVNVSMNKILDI